MYDPKSPSKRDLDEPRVAANDNDVPSEAIEIEELEHERLAFEEDDRFDFSDDDDFADPDDMFK